MHFVLDTVLPTLHFSEKIVGTTDHINFFFFNCRWSHRLRRQQMLLASFVSQQHHVHVLGRSRGSPLEETTSISVGSISETSTISFWRRRQRTKLCQTRCFWRQVRKHFFFFKLEDIASDIGPLSWLSLSWSSRIVESPAAVALFLNIEFWPYTEWRWVIDPI